MIRVDVHHIHVQTMYSFLQIEIKPTTFDTGNIQDNCHSGSFSCSNSESFKLTINKFMYFAEKCWQLVVRLF